MFMCIEQDLGAFNGVFGSATNTEVLFDLLESFVKEEAIDVSVRMDFDILCTICGTLPIQRDARIGQAISDIDVVWTIFSRKVCQNITVNLSESWNSGLFRSTYLSISPSDLTTHSIRFRSGSRFGPKISRCKDEPLSSDSVWARVVYVTHAAETFFAVCIHA